MQIFQYLCTKILQSFCIMTQNEIKQLRSLHMKKYRDELGLFVAEGDKCISELAQSFTLVHHLTPANTPIKDIERLSSLRTPQGSIAVFRKPAYELPTPQAGTLYLALDGIQDPGNLGTIIRTADWFGIRDIICSPDTADCFSPKVVQATMGSLAHVSITYCDLVPLLREANVPVYGTLLDGQDIYQQTLSGKGIIVMGNEGNGISPEVRQLITHKLLIPNFNKNNETAESLNVAIATAITCSEFRRHSQAFNQ